jgi:alpha-glucoside transport system substrate-binding protein
MQLFRTPPKAAMVFGGSAVIPVLGTKAAVAARPASQFDTFAFPRIAKGQPRVVGATDVVVMLKDRPAARSLISYLATPQAATVWAKRGGFLSPNAKVAVASYPLAGSRTMATQVTKTSIFRLGLAGLEPAAFQTKLSSLLQAYVRSPARIGAITKAIEAAASKT